MRVLKTTLLGAICFCCVCSFAVAERTAENVSAGPILSVVEPIFNFKDVNEGDTVEHSFTVVNTGDQVLTIRNVKTSCKCTVPNFDRRISPGEKGVITLSLNTYGKKGNVQETATVLSNDPKQPSATLTITGNVQVFVTVEPRGVYLEGYKEEEIIGRVTITSHHNKEKPLTLAPAKYSLGGMITYEIKPVEEGKEFEVVIHNIRKTEGKYNGNITLDTNYPEKPKVNIRFVGHISGDFEVSPEALYFGRLQKIEDPDRLERLQKNEMDSGYRKSVNITLNKGEGLKIEKIEKNEDLFETVTVEMVPGKSYSIEVRVKPDKIPQGNVSEEMRVYTSLADHPVVTIPIQIQSLISAASMKE